MAIRVASASTAVAVNIAPTAKEIILLTLSLIPFRSARLENLNEPIKFINGKIDIVMASQSTESKRLLSYTIAEWACSLKYEHFSPEAIQAAKLFWFDSIGCALGGSQQDDAKILLKHYLPTSGRPAAGGSKATTFGSGFKTNPVDAAVFDSPHIPALY